jgi:hypothetical protein
MKSNTCVMRANRKPVQRFSDRGALLPYPVLDTELYSRFSWQERVSSGGVPIMVARLGRSALVRKAA